MELGLVRNVEASDTSIKYSFLTRDSKSTESIYFPFRGLFNREQISAHVVCLSSQSGCPIGCDFCATGRIKDGRNLTQQEIIDQYLTVKYDIHQRSRPPIDSIAMMGMGEPLLNLDNVLSFYQTMQSESNLKRFSISTVGLIPQIKRLRASNANVKLYLSVHSPDDVKRTQIIPVNKKYPISKVVAECAEYSIERNNTVVANYVLMEGINDSEDDAQQLADLLDPKQFDIQLNLWNEVPGFRMKRPDISKLDLFRKLLIDRGHIVDIQLSKGTDVGGGCGQFAGEINKVPNFKGTSLPLLHD